MNYLALENQGFGYLHVPELLRDQDSSLMLDVCVLLTFGRLPDGKQPERRRRWTPRRSVRHNRRLRLDLAAAAAGSVSAAEGVQFQAAFSSIVTGASDSWRRGQK